MAQDPSIIAAAEKAARDCLQTPIMGVSPGWDDRTGFGVQYVLELNRLIADRYFSATPA
jgi:hypothetical protein